MRFKYFLTLFICVAFFSTSQAQSPLILGGYNKKVKSGETTCVGVYGRDFNRILSMQYTLKWDTKQLAFKGVNALNLPNIDANNFGLNKTDEGIMTFAWYDQQLRGITLPDGESLYEVCFEAKASTGTTAYLQFISDPTVIEISMGDGILIDLRTEGGKIDIQ